MALTKFGIVCSNGNASIRRYVYPDSDAHMNSAANLSAGETLVLCGTGPYPNAAAWLAAVNAAVNTALGKPPGNPRCAVIDDNGNVVDVIMADPAIDQISGMTLIQDTSAGPGWTWTIGGGFVPPPSNPSQKPEP